MTEVLITNTINRKDSKWPIVMMLSFSKTSIVIIGIIIQESYLKDAAKREMHIEKTVGSRSTSTRCGMATTTGVLSFRAAFYST